MNKATILKVVSDTDYKGPFSKYLRESPTVWYLASVFINVFLAGSGLYGWVGQMTHSGADSRQKLFVMTVFSTIHSFIPLLIGIAFGIRHRHLMKLKENPELLNCLRIEALVIGVVICFYLPQSILEMLRMILENS